MQGDGRELITLRKEFTQEQLNELREEYLQNIMRFNMIGERVKELKAEQAVFTKQNMAILNKVISGYVDEEITLEYENDFDDGVRNYYDNNGEIVHSRKLRPTENQPTFLKAFNQ